MLYIDTSAAMKLVRPEVHSKALSDWLREHVGEVALSSVLIEVELLRATRRSAPQQLHRAADVLRGIGAVTLSPAVIGRAATYSDAALRPLDAIHLATAEHVRTRTREELVAFVAYDERLLTAAQRIGLPTATPGAS